MVKKTNKKTSKKSSSVKNKTKSKKRVGKTSWVSLQFIRLVLIVIGVFGIYRAWQYDWVEGVSVIVLAVIIWLIIELVRELRKK
jgi:DMSO reductase anchor subunit